jgi:hypothetical protein
MALRCERWLAKSTKIETHCAHLWTGCMSALTRQLAAWTGEKAGRLKLNGHLFTYSPLSRLEELELLALSVPRKRTLWQTLHLLAQQKPRLSLPGARTPD